MSIYKNKYLAEKTLFDCFKKEILFSRKMIVLEPPVSVKDIDEPVVEAIAAHLL